MQVKANSLHKKVNEINADLMITLFRYYDFDGQCKTIKRFCACSYTLTALCVHI